VLGFAEVCGGQVVGIVRDKTSNRIANLLIIVLTSTAVAVLLIFVTTKTWNVSVYFMLFFWGF
jgi:predicted MFS family arabinose efflux permease